MPTPEQYREYSAKMLLWPLLVEMEFYYFFTQNSHKKCLDAEVIMDKIWKAARMGWFKMGSINEDVVTPESIFGISPNSGYYEFLWNV